MDLRTGRIADPKTDAEMRRAIEMGMAIPLDQRELTERQAREQRVRPVDVRAMLGMRLGKARNWPCPCGSGMKVKKCCGVRGTTANRNGKA